MKSSNLKQILETACAEHVFSAYSLYCERGDSRISLCGGTTSYWDNGAPVTEATWFDIGSVTKAVFTATLVARLLEASQLSLDNVLKQRLPELVGTPYADLRLRDLLSHSAGLRGWLPLQASLGENGLLAWFLKHVGEVVVREPGEKSEYSDLGILLVGLFLERVVGPLALAFANEIKAPLGLTEVRFGPLLDRDGVAATEFHLDEGRLLHGEVFDDNCRALGGVATHAGLFATARGLGPWAREWLRAYHGNSKFIGEPTAKRMTRPAERVKESSWGYGWDTKSERGSSCGDLFSMNSFGHLGYPGCSVWVDPNANGFVVFLTNRVHPSRLDERIRSLRPKVHDELARIWNGLA